MKEFTAVLIGHNDCLDIDKEQLEIEIINLIQRGVTLFMSGDMGGFDRLCARMVYNLKKQYPDIRSIIVIPYLNFKIFDESLFDESDFPECLEHVPYRAKVIRRKQYMADNAAFAVCYVNYSFGGAARTLEYAQSHGCEIIKIKNRQQ